MSSAMIAKAQSAMTNKIQSVVDPLAARIAKLEETSLSSDDNNSNHEHAEIKMILDRIKEIEDKIVEINMALEGILAPEEEPVVEVEPEEASTTVAV